MKQDKEIDTMRNYLILILLFCTQQVLSQSPSGFFYNENFTSGYILTKDGEKKEGLINFQSDGLNGQTCHFKLDENAEIQIFSPEEIQGYRFGEEGKYYISEMISLDNNPRFVFLEYLVNGTMDLLFFTDKNDNNKHYYFIKDEEGKFFILQKNKDREKDGRLFVDNRYRQVLASVFANSTSLTQKSKKASFSRSSLISMIREYHDETCDEGEQCIVFKNDYRKQYLKFKFSAYTGIKHLSFDYPPYYTSIFNSFSFGKENVIIPVVGVQVDMSSPRITKYLSVQLDLSLSQLSLDKTYVTEEYRYEYNLKSKFFEYFIKARYTYPSGKFRPTAELGYGKQNTFGTKVTANRGGLERSQDFINSTSGPVVGLGLDYNVTKDQFIFLTCSYKSLNARAADFSVKHKVNILGVQLGYRW